MNKKEAFDYIKSNLTFLNPKTREAIETLHPELKESTDVVVNNLIHFIDMNAPKGDKERYLKWINEQYDDKMEIDNLSRFSIYKYDDDKSTIYLSDVFVGEKIRQMGNGNNILSVVDKIGNYFGAKYICLKVKKESFAQKWYMRHGFKKYIDDGDYIWMRKEIPENEN
jgi:predicted GNAT family N-acyltransferase